LIDVQDEYQGKERAVLLPGGWAHADEERGLTKEKLEQYKAGGIMSGTEVKWGKRTPPTEILSALGGGAAKARPLSGGDTGISAPTLIDRGSMCTA
jgi:hypothetical protein